VLKMNTTHSSSRAAAGPAYAQLQREMHDALRAQHPDWILPNGDCPTCDSYDARFTELLIVSLATERALAHRPNNPNLANTTKLPTFFVSNVGSRGHHPLATLGDPGNLSMPAGYAQPRKIAFPAMASAIRKCSHEKFM
jgi:hypothetical protein